MNALRALAPFALLALAALGMAQTTNSFANINLHGNESHTANGSTSATRTFSSGGGFRESHASASYGILKAYATATTYAAGGDYNYATSHSEFRDTITIDAADPSLNGTSGILTYSYSIDGNLSASGGGGFDDYYNATAVVSLSSGGGIRRDRLYGDGSSSSEGVVGDHTETVAFTFGQSFDLFLYLGAGAYIYDKDAMTATADFEHTALWGGFDSVTNGSGTPVGYTLGSLSGHDWTQASTEAVPEPSAFAALGLGAVALLRRRRKA